MSGAQEAWSELDALRARPVAKENGKLRFIFYGRMSTEHQDEATSHGWQLKKASDLVAALGGEIVEEVFDSEVSRSTAWALRPGGGRILRELFLPERTFDGVVIGEAKRMFYDGQFNELGAMFNTAGVKLAIPELNGLWRPGDTSHKLQMAISGVLSWEERETARNRVRAGMEAQVRASGRFQGGVAPYGFELVDTEVDHPNPKARARGIRLRKLALVEEHAEVVRRIYARRLEGASLKHIATELNEEDIPCPSAANPKGARNKRADGWQVGAVDGILRNERYTGYAVFGLRQRKEVSINPKNPNEGTRITRAPRESAPVRSEKPVHDVIIPMETFAAVQRMRAERPPSNRAGRKGKELYVRRPNQSGYLLRGLLRCSICGRRLESWRRDTVHDKRYYRCVARTLVPGSTVAHRHPTTFRISESEALGLLHQVLDRWLAPAHVERTLHQMLQTDVQQDSLAEQRRKKLTKRIVEAERQRGNLLDAIQRGLSEADVFERLESLKSDIALWADERTAIVVEHVVTAPDELRKALLQLRDGLDGLLTHATASERADFYAGLGVEMTVDPEERTVSISLMPTADRAAVLFETLPWTDPKN